MLSGRLPFSGDSAWQMAISRLTTQPVPLGTYMAEVDPGIAAIVDRCLQRNPRRRFSSARFLLEELDRGDSAWNVYGHKASDHEVPEAPGPRQPADAESAGLGETDAGNADTARPETHDADARGRGAAEAEARSAHATRSDTLDNDSPNTEAAGADSDSARAAGTAAPRAAAVGEGSPIPEGAGGSVPGRDTADRDAATREGADREDAGREGADRDVAGRGASGGGSGHAEGEGEGVERSGDSARDRRSAPAAHPRVGGDSPADGVPGPGKGTLAERRFRYRSLTLAASALMATTLLSLGTARWQPVSAPTDLPSWHDVPETPADPWADLDLSLEGFPPLVPPASDSDTDRPGAEGVVDPGLRRALNEAGDHLAAFDAEAAHRILLDALEHRPEDPRLRARLAETLWRLGRDRQAREVIQATAGHTAGLGWRDRQLAVGLRRGLDGKWAEARDVFESLWRSTSELELGLWTLEAHALSGRVEPQDEVLEGLRALPGAEGGDPRIDLWESRFVREEGEAERAVALALEAIEQA
ncbi:MAG: tetratricopeptide repeat protein, partial [Holophagales bacterium]|nr:tetratricopeptide repeat protein [Holophagales bacterium]